MKKNFIMCLLSIKRRKTHQDYLDLLAGVVEFFCEDLDCSCRWNIYERLRQEGVYPAVLIARDIERAVKKKNNKPTKTAFS